MKKLVTIISILSLITLIPVSSFAGRGHAYGHNKHKNITINNDDHSVNANANADANAGVNNNNSITFPDPLPETTVNNNGKGYRGFGVAPEMTYPGMPTYFGQATRNSNVQSVRAITLYKKTFTLAELKAMLKDVSVDANMEGDPEIEAKDTDTVTIVVDPPLPSKVRQVGLITVKSTNTETPAMYVLAQAALKTIKMGGDVLLVTAEGAGTQLKSLGWGIGLAYSRAMMSADEETSGVASGGMGISGGKAGYGSLPWIQGTALKTK
ncbi:MAG: hypothetical protein ACFFG0_01645 [Candidatus Thorarchaeota archaeon]